MAAGQPLDDPKIAPFRHRNSAGQAADSRADNKGERA
jgi:hypothetical protein